MSDTEIKFQNPQIDVVELYAPRYGLGAVVTGEHIFSITGKRAHGYICPSPCEDPHVYDKMAEVLQSKLRKYEPDIEIKNYAHWYVRYNKIRVGARFDQAPGRKHMFPTPLLYASWDGFALKEMAVKYATQFDNYLSEQKTFKKKNK